MKIVLKVEETLPQSFFYLEFIVLRRKTPCRPSSNPSSFFGVLVFLPIYRYRFVHSLRNISKSPTESSALAKIKWLRSLLAVHIFDQSPTSKITLPVYQRLKVERNKLQYGLHLLGGSFLSVVVDLFSIFQHRCRIKIKALNSGENVVLLSFAISIET